MSRPWAPARRLARLAPLSAWFYCAHMAERQKGTESYSLPREKRHRKPINLTLSESGLEALDALAASRGESRSQVVEALVWLARVRMDK